ncbi:MAG: hypothetical protein P8P81_00025 [Bacteroidia bacterium]|nr:hypothetical protein [Bacteroidia bacterium]
MKKAHSLEWAFYFIMFFGAKKSYFKNGQIKEVKLYKNGIQNGPYQTCFVSGERRVSANYKNGKLNGLYERWDNITHIYNNETT